ncbi:MAG TPA: glycosyltransferase 87 family protein [Solirubrobacterales bacterium]|nr:glycosyltransferase 87 family protein [Solirubrobacterales bacterium]
MLLRAKSWAPYALVALLSAWLASRPAAMGDWDGDAAAAVHALASGNVGDYLSSAPMMGPFATLVQAPFVALSGATGLTAYHWASFPCLLAAGLVGIRLTRAATSRGMSPFGATLLPLICLLNPLTLEALRYGHPEEILTAALVVAAMADAAEGNAPRTAILLGLAIASKQWAVIAILPVLMVLPRRRATVAAGAVAVTAALMLPAVVASPDSFFGVQREAATTGSVVTPWSAWYPLASSRTEVYEVGGERLEAHLEAAPSLADSCSHPLIVLLAFALPLAVAARRGLPLSPADGFALLALLALLRCVLDPVDNLYYHAPLLLALVGWDAFSARGLPLRSLAGVLVAAFFWQAWHHLSDPAVFNAAYLALAGLLGAWLASSLFAPFAWTGIPVSAVFAGRNPNFRD